VGVGGWWWSSFKFWISEKEKAFQMHQNPISWGWRERERERRERERERERERVHFIFGCKMHTIPILMQQMRMIS
jgi:hypothetical protein